MTEPEVNQTEAGDYVATPDELRVIDAAIASIDAGEIATDEEVEAAFARFRLAKP